MLYGRGPAVPAEVDERIAALARERLAGGNLVRLRRQRLVRRLVAASSIGAAAAVVALVVWIGTPAPKELSRPGSESRQAAMRAVDARDIDENGRVDILDAFALARRVEGDGTPQSTWDIDGDGRVDRRDVDAVAMAAVRLDRRADNRGAL